MKTETSIKAGAGAGVVIALVSLMVSDIHTVADYLLGQANPANLAGASQGFEFPYQLTGLMAWPVLIVASLVFAWGFLAAGRRGGQSSSQGLARATAIVIFLYAFFQALALIADIRYSQVIAAAGSNLVDDLMASGTLRGLASLLVGASGGIAMTILMALYFQRCGQASGSAGALIALAMVVIGIVSKTLSLWIAPQLLMALFMLAMAAKSLGLLMVSQALYHRAGPA